jgi:hypothetical protein
MSVSPHIRALDNARLPCSVDGCSHRRRMVSLWCELHGARLTYHGSVHGRNISKSEIASYVRLARKLFKKMEGHPALLAAESIMASLLNPGEEPRVDKARRPSHPGYLLHRELLRLEGVESREALAAVVGCYLYSFHQPRQLPDDVRLTYALARSVLKLRPRAVIGSRWNNDAQRAENNYRPIPGQASALLGRQLRTSLAPFLANLTAKIEADHQRTAERAMALRTPLIPTA